MQWHEQKYIWLNNWNGLQNILQLMYEFLYGYRGQKKQHHIQDSYNKLAS